MPILDVSALTKRYDHTQALRGLDLQAHSDEVLGIAGPNGAGKTTLIRLLAGEDVADSGHVTFNGMRWSDESDVKNVVAVVHQEPQLFPNLTVAENLLVGPLMAGVRRPTPGDAERSILDELGIAGFADRPLGSCSLVVWQLTEIARALRRDARIFLFDEPNSALSEEESERLFQRILDLAKRQHVVMIVSHRLAELVDLCDRVAVIREGRCAAILEGDTLTQDALARELVVGVDKRSSDEPPRRDVRQAEAPADALLRVAGWTHTRNAFQDVEMEVRRGQIVALMGVEGSGGRELVRSLVGLEPGRGELKVGGTMGGEARIGYLPADRRTSLFPNFSIGANLTARLGRPRVASRWGRLRKGRMYALGTTLMSDFRVRARSVRQPIGTLSGGNQQKVAVAAAAATDPQLLVVEEPTRGVDVGTKAEIYRLLRSFAAAGNGVVAFCTEIPEVFDLADEVRVIHAGSVSKPLKVSDFDHVKDLAAGVARATREQEVKAP